MLFVVDLVGTVSAQTSSFIFAVHLSAELKIKGSLFFIVATNCNLSHDWLVSVNSGKCKICRK